MRKYKLILALSGILAVLAGCSGKDDHSSADEGEVAVRFAVADSNPSATRAAIDFAADIPARVYVFRRSDPGVPADIAGTPYRTFDTTTDGAGGLNNPNADGKTLSALSGRTYDFYVLVNPPAEELTPYSWSLRHGLDLLAGSDLGVDIARGSSSVAVDFGDLPHLGSQLRFRAAPSDELLNAIAVNSFSVGRVTWSKLPAWGTFALGQSKITTSNDYSGSFTLVPQQPGATPDFTVSGAGVALPFPAVYTSTTNRIDMQFALELNGGGVTFDAAAVEVPAFAPGYSYEFVLELQPNDNQDGAINLLLVVAPWDGVDWSAGMGGDDGSITVIKLGSWDSVTWRAGMGGDDTTMTIISVSGWSSLTWAAIMGENN